MPRIRSSGVLSILFERARAPAAERRHHLGDRGRAPPFLAVVDASDGSDVEVQLAQSFSPVQRAVKGMARSLRGVCVCGQRKNPSRPAAGGVFEEECSAYFAVSSMTPSRAQPDARDSLESRESTGREARSECIEPRIMRIAIRGSSSSRRFLAASPVSPIPCSFPHLMSATGELIGDAIDRYVPALVRERLLADGAADGPTCTPLDAAVLFADIAGFTAELTERLGAAARSARKRSLHSSNEYFRSVHRRRRRGRRRCSSSSRATRALAVRRAGDGAGLEACVQAAAETALRLQRVLASVNTGADNPVATRIAIGAGPLLVMNARRGVFDRREFVVAGHAPFASSRSPGKARRDG